MSLSPAEAPFRFLSHPYGSSLLQLRSKFVDIYNNSGAKVASVSNPEALREPRAAFWCLDCCVGILNNTGGIHLISTVGELVRRLPAPEHSRVVVDAPYPGGIAIVTESQTFWVFESAKLFKAFVTRCWPTPHMTHMTSRPYPWPCNRILCASLEGFASDMT
jgi:hypothetical protein